MLMEHGFIQNFTKYKFLWVKLVKRDITVKYRVSVLGIFWSFFESIINHYY